MVRHRVLRSRLLNLLPLLALFLSTEPVFAQPAPDGEFRHIREIRFYRSNVYTEEEAEDSSWSRFTNGLHIKTHESVIRNRILFEEGDVLDMDLVEQSERTLRRFSFLNEAQITVVPVDVQSVDIEVHTQDAWSLVPGLSFGGGGDLYNLTAELEEINLLGAGKTAFIKGTYQTDIEDWTVRVGYRDPQIFNSRWTGTATYTNGPLVESVFASASKPLYSIDSKWSYGGSGQAADMIVRRFENGEEFSRFGKDQIFVQAFMKRSFGERFKKTNLKFSLRYLKKDFSLLGDATTEPPPPDQANVTPILGIGRNNTEEWKELTYLDKMGLTEDTWIGHGYGGNVGYGIPVEGGFELWDVGVFYSKSNALGNKRLLKTIVSLNSEVVRKTIAIANIRFYRKFSRHTVATRLKINAGWDLDDLVQFTMGADSGLRGYPARQFTGEKLLLVNLEDRQFWGEYKIGPKVALGTVIFVDVGNVWKEDQSVELMDLNWGAGVGLRLGWSSLPKQPIFRIDFGWAIGGHDSFAVSIGSEQYF